MRGAGKGLRVSMKRNSAIGRIAAFATATVLLAGCQIIPNASRPTASAPQPPQTTASAPQPTAEPSATALPAGDSARHRVALLLPMSGENGKVGNSIANATMMAILDTNATDLRITTYDTAGGARAAARRAVEDGNKLILGPLVGSNVTQVLAEARPANVPIITYSNDASVAAADVLVMGQVPAQSIVRTVGYARERGARNFASIVPFGDYGTQVADAFATAVRDAGGRIVANESYERGNTSIVGASRRIAQNGGYDTVLVADGSRLAALAANELRPRGQGTTQLLGTELLSGEAGVTRTPSMRGMVFSAISDQRFKRFSESYNERFGEQPYRIATLGYDSVLLTLRVARDWKTGRDFPTGQLRDSGGFLGLDGPFRFGRSGVIERAMEVREIRDGQVVIVDPAPTSF